MFTFIRKNNDTDYLNYVPAQAVKDKIAKNRGWAICASRFNFDTKGIDYLIALNAEKTFEKHVTAEEICKDYGWKDFTFSENFEAIFPVKE